MVVSLFKAARSVGPSGPWSPAISVDLDGDGWLDLAWARQVQRVALNDRSGGFRDLFEVSWAGWPLAFGDVNGDGHLDEGGNFSSVTSNVVRVGFGRGDGTFANSLDISIDGFSPASLSLGDLDGDKKADLVAVGGSTSQLAVSVAVVLGIGEGQRKTSLTFGDTNEIPKSTLIRDLDGDGHQDVVIAGATTTYVLRNAGAGVLGDLATYEIGMPIAVADFDGDGRLDLYGDHRRPGAAILFGREGGFAEPAPLQPEVCEGSRSVAAGDVNDDGRPDLACAVDTTRLYLNLGRGTFAAPRVLSGVGEVAAILDWDHDGDADIVADGGTTVFFNEGGAFPELPLPKPFTGAFPASGWSWASPAELNGDGVPDVVVVAANTLSTRVSGSGGTLGPETRVADLGLMERPGIGDVDGDGRPDVVFPDGEPLGHIGVAINDGNGQLLSPTFFEGGSYPTAAEVVDLNGDGKNDVVTLVAAGVSVLLNDGLSGFPTHVDYRIADASALASGDVNGDGAPDVVTVAADGTYVSRNLGDGTLGPAVHYPHAGWLTPPFPSQQAPSSALTLLDLNGDDRPEIALALVGDIIVLRNKGDGTFGTLIPIIGRNPAIPDDPLAPRNLTAGDLNGDRLPDLVALYGNTTRTFFSDGKGTLLRGEVYSLAPSPIAFATGDLNGDGRVDLKISLP